VSSEVQPSAARAEAVLRAAEAAAAAARGDDTSDPGRADAGRGPGVPASLLAAADELEAQLAQARARLDELEAALERLDPDHAADDDERP
jgi:hypothetical protein